MTEQQTPYKAADFSLVDSEGNTKTLHDFAGQWLVLYFYPKDDTPGCTVEACSLQDAREELRNINAQVVGVSKDSQESHQKFKSKYNLDFALLSDPEGTTLEAYGAWGKKAFGREGVLRKTFLIDPDGMVQKVYGRVTPLGHGEQVTKDLRKLQAAAAEPDDDAPAAGTYGGGAF